MSRDLVWLLRTIHPIPHTDPAAAVSPLPYRGSGPQDVVPQFCTVLYYRSVVLALQFAESEAGRADPDPEPNSALFMGYFTPRPA